MDWLLDNALAVALIASGLLQLVVLSSLIRGKYKTLDYIGKLHDRAEVLQGDLKRVRSELASVRVKHGQAWEVYIPYMDKYFKELGDKNNAVFLGRPIDLIYFNEDEVVFVEVKTGNSGLSQKQRRIKKLIKDKKVSWVEVNDELPQEG